MKRISKSSFILVFVLLLGISFAWAQNGTITGTVTDDAGNPMSRANVQIAGASMGGATANDGSYEIANVPPGSYTLTASFIGFIKSTTQVELQSGKPQWPISL